MSASSILNKWRVLSFVCIAIGAVRVFFAPTHPHAHRQVDTLGVALRYARRWFFEIDSSLPWFIPSVIDRAETNGAQAMEFPFLNMLGGLVYVADPYWGMVFAQIAIFGISLLLFAMHWKTWNQQKVAGADMAVASLLLACCGVSSQYFGKFMPDFISFILVSSAIGLAWKPTTKRLWAAALLASLGLLIKPTSVVAFVLLILHPDLKFGFKWRPSVKHVWLFVAVLAATFYYTKGMEFLRSYQESTDIFAVKFRNPLQSLIESFYSPAKILDVFWDSVFLPGVLPLLLVMRFFSLKNRENKANFDKLLVMVCIQVIAILALDGTHSFIHRYYYIATSMIACMMVVLCVSSLEKYKFWGHLLFILVAAKQIDAAAISFSIGNNNNTQALHLECAKIRRDTTNNKSLIPWNSNTAFTVSGKLPYPRLAVCFGERTTTLPQEFGFYLVDEVAPENCNELAAGKLVRVVRCTNTAGL